MQLGMIGLGRMGADVVRQLLRGGHQCVVFDVSPTAVDALVQEQAVGTSGGIRGLERRYCTMIGGEADVLQR